MLTMRVESLVSAIVRQELCGKQERKKEALHFHFDCSISHLVGHKYYRTRQGLHLLYCAPNHRNYVSVFSAWTTSPFTKIKEIGGWKHEITHDSCWSTIDVFSRAYFAMAVEVNRQLIKAGLETVAPAEMSEHNNFALFGPAFEWVPAEMKTDPACERNYRKLITVI